MSNLSPNHVASGGFTLHLHSMHSMIKVDLKNDLQQRDTKRVNAGLSNSFLLTRPKCVRCLTSVSDKDENKRPRID
jgi:hypothetical protein